MAGAAAGEAAGAAAGAAAGEVAGATAGAVAAAAGAVVAGVAAVRVNSEEWLAMTKPALAPRGAAGAKTAAGEVTGATAGAVAAAAEAVVTGVAAVRVNPEEWLAMTTPALAPWGAACRRIGLIGLPS